VNKSKSKIGFSKNGGIFIGQNIQSDFHKHYAVSIIMSLGKPFKIIGVDKKQDLYKVAVIQKNTTYKLESDKNEKTIFIHIVPYSENGIKFSNKNKSIQRFDIEQFEKIINELIEWFESSKNDKNKVEYFLVHDKNIIH